MENSSTDQSELRIHEQFRKQRQLQVQVKMLCFNCQTNPKLSLKTTGDEQTNEGRQEQKSRTRKQNEVREPDIQTQKHGRVHQEKTLY